MAMDGGSTKGIVDNVVALSTGGTKATSMRTDEAHGEPCKQETPDEVFPVDARIGALGLDDSTVACPEVCLMGSRSYGMSSSSSDIDLYAILPDDITMHGESLRLLLGQELIHRSHAFDGAHRKPSDQLAKMTLS